MELSFGQLRDANVRRCEHVYHPLTDWSPTDWATAAAGELGEALNLVKKMRRLTDIRGQLIDPEAWMDLDRLRGRAADELADTVIYLDLLAARLGIRLDDAVRAKFNRTSEEAGSAERL